VAATTATKVRTSEVTDLRRSDGAGARVDTGFRLLALGAGLLVLAILAGIAITTTQKAWPAFSFQGLSYFTSTHWNPNNQEFGALPFIYGTFIVSALALLLGVPASLGIALFTTEVAPRRLRSAVVTVIDLLAAVPSVVFGLWGGRYLAGFIQPVHVWLHNTLGFLPFFGPPSPNGRSLLTAGVVLAIMILPIVTAISREIFAQTPTLHQEAALALGATRWEMIRYAVFPYARSGMISGVMLGLGRALGETMAVAMVLAVTPLTTLNVIGTASPATVASNIALNYKESTPTRQSLLIATGLILFALTFVVNFAARWVAGRSERRLSR